MNILHGICNSAISATNLLPLGSCHRSKPPRCITASLHTCQACTSCSRHMSNVKTNTCLTTCEIPTSLSKHSHHSLQAASRTQLWLPAGMTTPGGHRVPAACNAFAPRRALPSDISSRNCCCIIQGCAHQHWCACAGSQKCCAQLPVRRSRPVQATVPRQHAPIPLHPAAAAQAAAGLHWAP